MKKTFLSVGVLAVSLTCFMSCGSSQNNFVSLAAVPVLYETLDETDGNMGGRAGADALCLANKPVSFHTDVRAFLSVNDSDDEIRDMPENYGVPTDQAILGLNNVEIAADWDDLLDEEIEETLSDAGITANTYWTGSLDDGSSAEGDDCDGWTDENSTDDGAIGDPDVTSGGWLADAPADCSDTHVILCIAFNPAAQQ